MVYSYCPVLLMSSLDGIRHPERSAAGRELASKKPLMPGSRADRGSAPASIRGAFLEFGRARSSDTRRSPMAPARWS